MDGGEYVYGSDQEYDTVGASSEPVQGLATSVYKEFERMIAKYDQDVVRDLMPLVITMLETLDQTITEKNEFSVEIELLEEDKKQLKSQYERERHSKRTAEQRLLETEDNMESISRELKQTNEKLDVMTRQLEMKSKSYSDQLERLQDREAELKKEYNELHQRHSEMIRNYVGQLEKFKILQQPLTPDITTYSPVARKKKQEIIESISPLSPDTPSIRTVDSTPVKDSFDETENLKVKRNEWERPVDPFHPNIKQEIMEIRKQDEDSRIDSTISTSKEENHHDLFSDGTSIESVSSGPDSGQVLSHEFQQNLLKLGCPIETSTPTHDDVEVTFVKNQSTLNDCGVENEGFDHVEGIVTNNNSLFAELDGKDLGDVDDGADLLGMGKELENLMLENTKLMATKNALDIVKDDLIHQVDQLTNQLTMLQEDLDRAHHAKDLLSKKASELEIHLKNAEKKAKEAENLSPTSQASKTPDEDDIVPTSQRKRFTRVEMARVLMERNQYKERLMELQEAVRWTEMLRASRDHPSEAEVLQRPKPKNRSSISVFFSKLFGPANPPPPNASPSRRRLNPNSPAEDIKMRHSKSDSFTTAQSVTGK